ncbi:MAG: lamin tail domain-containing protein [Bacteroidales bacterium]|nr:lamin tail domain-containing protein [Bacteroidales bacterium]
MRMTVLLFLFLSFGVTAQVVDDFSDGDFNRDPEWVGTDSCFTVNNALQLQSAATTAGEAWLSVRYDIPASGFGSEGETEWRFWIREAFSPSGNNYAEVWLVADTADLRHATYGYFMRFGAAGSQDAIELFRKDPEGDHLICAGAPAAIATSFKVAVKVNRDREGHWTLRTDYENMGNYMVEAEGIDSTSLCGGYFGFHLFFTSSNARKFYFDDIYIGPTVYDMLPPELVRLEVRDASHLLLCFDEPLSMSALDATRYEVEPGTLVPDTVCFASRPSEVLLAFHPPLPINVNCRLTVRGICDLSENVMDDMTCDFAVYVPMENDVVINEIMADPSPPVGLPEWEYVELFNTTALPIDLTGWRLEVGTTERVFPAVGIDPQGFLILCKADAASALSSFGPTCGFSSFSIANAGTALHLLSPDGTVVSEVSFNDTWYHDAEKKEGGWSLEQIDPYNPCAGTYNWTASTDPSGGTPGRENAVNAPNAFQPSLDRVSMLGDAIVLLWFDQQMNRSSLGDPSHYQVMETGSHPIEVICNPLNATSVELLFETPFQEGALYTLAVREVENCSGHPIGADAEISFGIPFAIGASEVLINEILFDPIEPGVDYVELYNVSEKTFDLSELKLGVIKESFPNPADTVLKEISSDPTLFLPHTYMLLSTDGLLVTQQYGCDLGAHVDMKSFPSYPNAGATVVLMSRQGVVVDQMAYSESMHYPLLKETKGVSLERVSWEVSSSQPDNWHSAAESVHFGTPGYENSMAVVAQESEIKEGGVVRILPEVFSPDGDGIDDHCQVIYAYEEAGCTMNVYVFNVDGQMVRHLVRGELVAKEGEFVWNGLDNRGNRVSLGIYVLVTEVFDMHGNVRRYRNAVSVASR